MVPPEGYLKGVAALCKKHNVLLICDEIQTVNILASYCASYYPFQNRVWAGLALCLLPSMMALDLISSFLARHCQVVVSLHFVASASHNLKYL